MHLPTPKELLQLNLMDKHRIQNLELIKGEHVEEKGSIFHSYAVSVITLDDVKFGYIKVKQLHINATHITCAYMLPGNNTVWHQDSIDDGEHGVGRAILKKMRENQAMN